MPSIVQPVNVQLLYKGGLSFGCQHRYTNAFSFKMEHMGIRAGMKVKNYSSKLPSKMCLKAQSVVACIF